VNRAHEGETRPAKSRDSTMIAGGSEPSPEDLGSHDSAAIQRKGVDAQTQLKRSESELPEPGGTRVPDFGCADAPLAQVRRAWGVLRVV